MGMRTIRVTQSLTNAWEVWMYTVPDDATREDIEAGRYDGSIVDSGFDLATIENIEEV
jgi:hypothetical protein